MYKQDLIWLQDLCVKPRAHTFVDKKFLLYPFRVGDYAIASEGHFLVAVKLNGKPCYYKISDDGAKLCQKFLDLPSGIDVFPFKPLKDWAAHRYDDSKQESSILHGSAIDRVLLWKCVRNLESETYKINLIDVDGVPKSMFVLDGDDWRVVIMGLRNTVQTGMLAEYKPESKIGRV